MLQNSRQSLLRSARETRSEAESASLQRCAADLASLISRLSRQVAADADKAEALTRVPFSDELGAETHELDQIRGYEGQGASLYFEVFALHLRQQREDFAFTTRSRRPPRDVINCLLSYLYALIRHDWIAALTAALSQSTENGKVASRKSLIFRDSIWILLEKAILTARGAFLGLIGLPLPGVEVGIALSALLLGAMVCGEVRPKLAVAALLVGAFAVFHGHAHGTELPAGQSGLLYSMGFVITTGSRRPGYCPRVAPLLAGRKASAAWRRSAHCGHGCPVPMEGPDMSRLEYQHRWHRALATGSALLLWPWHAEAHLVTTGLGPVYDGLRPPPDDARGLAPVLALALCAGLRGAGAGRRVLGVLPSAWLVGGCVGLLTHRLPVFPLPILLLLSSARWWRRICACPSRRSRPWRWFWPGARCAQWRGHAAGGRWEPGTAGYADRARCASNARGRQRGGAPPAVGADGCARGR